MRKKNLFIVVVLIVFLTGCRCDIVCTKNLKKLSSKCVYVEPLNTEDQRIGLVLRDVVEKEFVRQKFEICDSAEATMFVTGAAFLTERSTSNKNLLGASGVSNQAIESVSLVVKDKDGQILATASYDNSERFTASKLATELGSALAGKLR